MPMTKHTSIVPSRIRISMVCLSTDHSNGAVS
jgi:hypothetical protein